MLFKNKKLEHGYHGCEGYTRIFKGSSFCGAEQIRVYPKFRTFQRSRTGCNYKISVSSVFCSPKFRQLLRKYTALFLNNSPMRTVILLAASNIFITFAWYYHLKHQGWPLWKAIVISWFIALIVYCLAVPANRLGHSGVLPFFSLK